MAKAREQIGDAATEMRWFTGEDLSGMEVKRKPHVIAGLMTGEGANVMAGDAKVGKTVIGLEACIAVATGEPFLGRYPVQQGGAVYWMADDPNESRFAHNYQRIVNGRRLPNFIAAVDRRPLVPDGALELEKAIRQVEARIVFIDCYSAIRAQRKPGQDFVQSEYDEMRLLGELAAKHRCGITLLHHMATAGRGNNRSANVFNLMAGSFAVAAGPDGLLAVQSFSKTRTERLMTFGGRDIDNGSLVYARGLDGRLFFVAEGAIAEAWDEVYRMYQAIGEDAIFSGKAIGEALGLTERQGRRKASILRQVGALLEVSDRKYCWDDGLLPVLGRVREANRARGKVAA